MAKIPRGYNAGYDPKGSRTAHRGQRGYRARKGDARFLVALLAWLRATYAVDDKPRETYAFRAPEWWEAALLFMVCAGVLWAMLGRG